MSDDQNTNEQTENDNSKLLASVAATRKERDELAKKLKKYESIDIDKYSALLESEKQREEKDLESEKAFSELKSRWAAKENDYKSKLEDLNNKIKSINTRYEVERSFYALGGLSAADETDGVSYFDLAYEQVSRYLLYDKEGNLEIVNPRTKEALVNPNGDPFSLNDLMGKIRSSPVGSALFSAPESANGGGGMIASKGRQAARTITSGELRDIGSGKAGLIEDIASGKVRVV